MKKTVAIKFNKKLIVFVFIYMYNMLNESL